MEVASRVDGSSFFQLMCTVVFIYDTLSLFVLVLRPLRSKMVIQAKAL